MAPAPVTHPSRPAPRPGIRGIYLAFLSPRVRVRHWGGAGQGKAPRWWRRERGEPNSPWRCWPQWAGRVERLRGPSGDGSGDTDRGDQTSSRPGGGGERSETCAALQPSLVPRPRSRAQSLWTPPPPRPAPPRPAPPLRATIPASWRCVPRRALAAAGKGGAASRVPAARAACPAPAVCVYRVTRTAGSRVCTHPPPQCASLPLLCPVAAAVCAWNRGGAPGTVSQPGRSRPPSLRRLPRALDPTLEFQLRWGRRQDGLERASLRNPHSQTQGLRRDPTFRLLISLWVDLHMPPAGPLSRSPALDFG